MLIYNNNYEMLNKAFIQYKFTEVNVCKNMKYNNKKTKVNLKIN